MYFGRLPVEQTAQSILAHSVKLKDRTLKKGRVITAGDIADLKNAGLATIVVARLDAEDIGEDAAARALAEAVTHEDLAFDKPFTGRCNIRAGCHGLLHVNSAGVEHINRVHESLTIATLPDLTVIAPNDMVATVKIIPFAVESAILHSCLDAARKHAPIIQVLPFVSKRAGLIQTQLPGIRTQVLDKTSAVLEQRLGRLQSHVVQELRCRHDEIELQQAIQTLLKTGIDLLLIIGASVIVDRRDIVPGAITASGGDIIHFGMPTDPGNLLLLARHGNIPVLGLPGCARKTIENETVAAVFLAQTQWAGSGTGTAGGRYSGHFLRCHGAGAWRTAAGDQEPAAAPGKG